jgi:hypothetical protein
MMTMIIIIIGTPLKTDYARQKNWKSYVPTVTQCWILFFVDFNHTVQTHFELKEGLLTN